MGVHINIHKQQKAETVVSETNNTAVYLHDVFLCSTKKEWSAGTCSNANEAWKHMLNARNQVRKIEYCMTLFICNIQN